MKFLIGLLIGLLIVPIGIWLYLTAGSPPVATGDAPLPFEAGIVHLPLHARIDRELVKTPPVEASPTNLEIGAHIYRQQCAACHGLYGRPASFAKGMYPRGASALGAAPQRSRRRQRRPTGRNLLEGGQRYPALRHACLQEGAEPDRDVAGVATAGQRR